jgi:hypothetical protein
MIQSHFIIDLLDLLVEGDKDELLLRKQIPHLTEETYHYTGSGLMLSFGHSEAINAFALTADTTVIDGIIVESTVLHEAADAAIFIKDGLIDYLELWSRSGSYPESELPDYILTQAWIGSPQKQIRKG